MEFYAGTDIGKYREKNEDFLYAEKHLFIVADGMGGHRAGEVASRLAVESFTENFYQILKDKSSEIASGKEAGNLTQENIKELLVESIKKANRSIFTEAMEKPEFYSMGTTLTACYIQKDTAYIVHIGDSRLYIKRGSSFKPLTSDHTIVGELYRRGELSYEDTFNHPQKNYLTNVLGVAEDINPDFFSHKILPEDILLLCSDGLNSMLKDKDIAGIIDKYESARDITRNLIKGAIAKGGLDNITVIVIKA
jgi:serine/threonine protein phosphatase PrpC